MKSENNDLFNTYRASSVSLSFSKPFDSSIPFNMNSVNSQEYMADRATPKIRVKRLDHLGLVAGIIKKLEIVKVIDEALGKNDQEHISVGEAIAGMVLNGFGYTNKPLMLTPQFFENKALSLLFRDGVKAEHFNKHKLGRALDKVSEFGSPKLFNIVSSHACNIEGVDLSTGHNDTTSYSVSGEYDDEFDTYPIKLALGHSKDNRPGDKQVVQELMVSEDGGIPFATKVFDGNASDNVIFRERAKLVMNEFAKSTNRLLVADSKLLTKKSAHFLKRVYFVTRLGGPAKAEENAIIKAIESDLWEDIDDNYKTREFKSKLHNIGGLRLIVTHSNHARKKAEKTLKNSADREKKEIDKKIFHLQAKRFMCEKDAQKALEEITKKWKFHRIDVDEISEHKKYAKTGCPKKGDPYTLLYQIKAKVFLDQALLDLALNKKSCFVLTTNMPKEKLTAEDALKTYKNQDRVEKGFAFLKSPEFFTSSFYLKSPKRIEALVIMVMTLALLVYSIAQRRLRKQLAHLQETLPNQIKQETKNPTLRWVFQLLEGINYVELVMDGIAHTIIEGLTELRIKILSLLGPEVMEKYKIL